MIRKWSLLWMNLQTPHPSQGLVWPFYHYCPTKHCQSGIFTVMLCTHRTESSKLKEKTNRDIFRFTITETKNMLITSGRFFMDYSWSRTTSDKGVNKLLSTPKTHLFFLQTSVACHVVRQMGLSLVLWRTTTTKSFPSAVMWIGPGIQPGIQWWKMQFRSWRCNFKRASKGLAWWN